MDFINYISGGFFPDFLWFTFDPIVHVFVDDFVQVFLTLF